MPQLAISENHTDVRNEISSILSKDSEQSGHTYSPCSLTLGVVDSGRIVGGLAGSANWEWLYIETLAIAPDFRKQGLAKQLVLKAEGIAQDRGCYGSWVDTFTFQVPDFYVRSGYDRFAELPNYPGGHSRIFLRKFFALS